MIERELKLLVPPHRQAAVKKELRRLKAVPITLHACYFDTETRELAQEKTALRLRLEGDQWVQTVKMPGGDELSRIELNHPRPDASLDLDVYKRTPVAAAFKKLQHPLVQRYETQVERLVLEKEARGGVVELAYDTGVIKAGTLELPLCELELELLSGDAREMMAMGERWLTKHQLVVDLRSKAERGDNLANGSEAMKPRHAGAIDLDPELGMDAAYIACATDCVNQIVRNATLLGTIDVHEENAALFVGYVHQLRVGIRRLRSCWKFFGKWLALDIAELGDELREYFGRLGQARDADVLRTDIEPRLVRAGMPALTTPEPADNDLPCARTLAASPAFQSTLLRLLGHLLMAGEIAASKERQTPRAGKGKLGKALAERLNKWLNAMCEQGAQFEHLTQHAQHDLRKDVKRLRYSMEFSSSLLAPDRMGPLREALLNVQKILGELNDLYVAQSYYQPLAETQAYAMFALGWLRAMQDMKKAQAQAAFRHLGDAARFKPA
jgi:inorganic triphosphatase YgiF